jgi:pimeloyl-ACP methyl ester carboxylesterase
MQQQSVVSHDGIVLRYAVRNADSDKPWIAFIMPFGLKMEMATPFFDFFEPHYRIVTWEARSILEESDRGVREREFSVENHVLDVRTILDHSGIAKAIFVGYCSGAGIAIAVANRFAQLIDRLILVHGEFVLLDHENCTTQFSREIDALLSMAAKDEEHLSLVFEKVENQRIGGAPSRPSGIDLPFTKLRHFRRYAANYLEYKSADFLALARQVGHKTLLMCGGMDAQVNLASAQKMNAAVRHSEVFIDPRADHYGILRDESPTLVRIWNYLCEEAA